MPANPGAVETEPVVLPKRRAPREVYGNWALRTEAGTGKTIIMVRHHDADRWWDVAELRPNEDSLGEMIVEQMNRAARPRI